MKKFFVFLSIFLILFHCAQAHDFVVTLNKQNIYFSIISDEDKTAEVTYPGRIASLSPIKCSGEIEIPSKVRHNDSVYSIVAIGAKAFSGATNLTGIILPESITRIGDFAFEGCTSLKNVVFPHNSIEFGQGVFFKCTSINTVKIGRNWAEINLRMFQWSDSLKTITIPAKITKIRNLKSLKHLTEINVDSRNLNFSSVEGILYNKDTIVLYGCPRAYEKSIKVPEGTEKITQGAFIDCYKIRKIDLPQTLTSISFREFSRIQDLEEIVLRASDPIITAKELGKQEVFMLQVANNTVKLIVPKKSIKIYKKVIATNPGEYSEKDSDQLYTVSQEQILNQKNLTGVSNIEKY